MSNSEMPVIGNMFGCCSQGRPTRMWSVNGVPVGHSQKKIHPRTAVGLTQCKRETVTSVNSCNGSSDFWPLSLSVSPAVIKRLLLDKVTQLQTLSVNLRLLYPTYSHETWQENPTLRLWPQLQLQRQPQSQQPRIQRLHMDQQTLQGPSTCLSWRQHSTSQQKGRH